MVISKCWKCRREREVDNVPVLLHSFVQLCLRCQIERNNLVDELNDNKGNQAELFISKAASLDARIKISTDIFNAETVAIAEIKKVIDADESIPVGQKHFRLAQAIETRYRNLNKVVNEKTDEIIELETKMRSLQLYFNTLGKDLREHERAQLRLKDLQYKPQAPTKVVKPKKEKLEVKKVDLAEVRKYAEQYGVMANIVQIFCIQRNIEPEAAAKLVAETMNAVKG